MTRSSRPLAVARRGFLVAAAAGAVALAGAPVASAATSPTAPAAVASPGTGIPVFGGLIDSIVGIVTGTAHGIAGAAGAVVCSVAPVCPPVRVSS
jgi:hypothetical protein